MEMEIVTILENMPVEIVTILENMPESQKIVIYGDLVAEAYRAGISWSTIGMSLDEAIFELAMFMEWLSTTSSTNDQPQPEKG